MAMRENSVTESYELNKRSYIKMTINLMKSQEKILKASSSSKNQKLEGMDSSKVLLLMLDSSRTTVHILCANPNFKSTFGYPCSDPDESNTTISPKLDAFTGLATHSSLIVDLKGALIYNKSSENYIVLYRLDRKPVNCFYMLVPLSGDYAMMYLFNSSEIYSIKESN